MKVLFISHIKESSGWGQAAKDVLLALDTAGVDVVSRCVKLGLPTPELPQRVLELEDKSSHDCDICIQFVLPHLMDYHGGFKNIGMYTTETSSFKYSGWVEKLNQMDELWVPCNQMKESAGRSGIKVPVKVIPYPCDTSKFKIKRETLDIEPISGDFVFYFIGDITVRKNLVALIKAFHLEFSTSEPVSLLLKASKYGVSKEENIKKIIEACNYIKSGLKLYPKLEDYKSEIIVGERLSEEDLAKLHMSCDCFVVPSYGEAWCSIPGTPIDTANGIKSIENIKVNDYVYSHKGILRKVNKILKRNYNGKIVKIKPYGISEYLSFTPEHQHYIVKRKNYRFGDGCINPEFINSEHVSRKDLWVVPKIKKTEDTDNTIKISDIVDVNVDNDGYITCPHSYIQNEHSLKDIAKIFNCAFQTVSKAINNKSNSSLSKKIRKFYKENKIEKSELTRIPNEIELNSEFMFFLGHYIAEGSTDGRHIEITTNKLEKYGRNLSSIAIGDMFDLIPQELTIGNTTRLIFNNTIIAKFLKNLCGYNAETKYIHPKLLNKKYINSLISGIFYGDGCLSKNTYSFSTNSKTLSRNIIEICNKNNIFITMSSGVNNTLKCIQQHNNRFEQAYFPYKYNKECKTTQYIGRRYLTEDINNFYLPIRDISSEKYNGIVYNLTIDKDNTYTCKGYATHNCEPAMDALGFGNPVITSNEIGTDFVNWDNGYICKSNIVPVCGLTDTFEDLFTGYENWHDIDINDLRKNMREAYTAFQYSEDKFRMAEQTPDRFSYEKIGNIMKEELCQQAQLVVY